MTSCTQLYFTFTAFTASVARRVTFAKVKVLDLKSTKESISFAQVILKTISKRRGLDAESEHYLYTCGPLLCSQEKWLSCQENEQRAQKETKLQLISLATVAARWLTIFYVLSASFSTISPLWFLVVVVAYRLLC